MRFKIIPVSADERRTWWGIQEVIAKVWVNRRNIKVTRFTDPEGTYYIFDQEWRRYYTKKPKGSYHSLSRKVLSKKLREWLNEC